MSDWRINIPHRGRDQPLDVEALNAAESLEGEERRIAEMVIWAAMVDPALATVGDLLDRVENASPAERRGILDAARREADLPTIATIEADRNQESFRRGTAHLTERDEGGFAWLTCAGSGCTRHPVHDSTGQQRKVNVRKWFCEEHRHLATEGDLEVWRPRIRYSRSGALEFGDEVEAEAKRQEREAKSRAARHAARLAESREEAERLAEFERAADARNRREHPPGFFGGGS